MPITVTINATPSSGQSPLSVGFTAVASGGSGSYAYQWAFGDGSYSNEGAPENPTHVYELSGTFLASVTAVDRDTQQIGSQSIQITVNTQGTGGLFPSGQGLQFNPNGSIRPFSQAEIDAMAILSRGVKDGSHPTHSRQIGSTTVRRTFFCAGPYLESFIAYMLGGATTYTDPTENPSVMRISRLLPQAYPGKPQVVATQIVSARGARAQGIDGAGTPPLPLYPAWEVEVLYEMVPFDLRTDAQIISQDLVEGSRYVQQLPSTVESKYLNLPGGSCIYRVSGGGAPNGKPVPYSIGIIEPTQIIKYRWNRVPYTAYLPGTPLYKRIYGDPESNELPFIGTINKTKFLGRPPGSMKLLGVEEDLVFDQLAGYANDPNKGLVWNLTYDFEYTARTLGWNSLYYMETTASGNAAAGYYNTVRVANPPVPYYPPGENPDGVSYWNCREFAYLFNVGVVPPPTPPPPP